MQLGRIGTLIALGFLVGCTQERENDIASALISQEHPCPDDLELGTSAVDLDGKIEKHEAFFAMTGSLLSIHLGDYKIASERMCSIYSNGRPISDAYVKEGIPVPTVPPGPGLLPAPRLSSSFSISYAEPELGKAWFGTWPKQPEASGWGLNDSDFEQGHRYEGFVVIDGYDPKRLALCGSMEAKLRDGRTYRARFASKSYCELAE